MDRPNNSLLVKYKMVVTFICKKSSHRLLRISETKYNCVNIVSAFCSFALVYTLLWWTPDAVHFDPKLFALIKIDPVNTLFELTL